MTTYKTITAAEKAAAGRPIVRINNGGTGGAIYIVADFDPLAQVEVMTPSKHGGYAVTGWARFDLIAKVGNCNFTLRETEEIG